MSDKPQHAISASEKALLFDRMLDAALPHSLYVLSNGDVHSSVDWPIEKIDRWLERVGLSMLSKLVECRTIRDGGTPVYVQWENIKADFPASSREVMEQADLGSWTDWIHPLPGYELECCDCGLVHEMEFAIGGTDQPPAALNEGEALDHVILFRARRLSQNAATNTIDSTPQLS